VTPGDLDSVTDVKEIFELARLLAPAALLLEDLDAVGEERSRQGQGGKVLLGELMSQIDGCHGDADLFVIATTNRADVLEQALRNRPGRFDRVIEVPPLGLDPCRAFLAARLGTHRVAPTDLDWLAAKSQGRTGAEIEDLIETVLVEAAGRQPEAETFEIGRELLEWALEAAPRAGRGLGF
jgi:cell division protease FtsH